MLTRVSIVAVPWPRPVQAARCSGQAPHTATGVASTRLAHGQPLNCAAGTIASTMTATARGTQTARRRPRARTAGSAAGSSASGAGAVAEYPQDSITPISSAGSRPPMLAKYALPVA